MQFRTKEKLYQSVQRKLEYQDKNPAGKAKSRLL